jgi:hypothetical protein
MKKYKFFAVYTVLLSALFINACEGQGGGTQPKSFNYDLRGTWVSNEQNGLYSGTLKIGADTITIDGYGENWLSLVGDENKRPFKDFPKRVPLKGYSEEGKIFIEYGGTVKDGIPYIYSETGTYQNKYKLLEFTFGGRPERLQLEENF